MDCLGIAYTIEGLSQRCETQHREHLSEIRFKRQHRADQYSALKERFNGESANWETFTRELSRLWGKKWAMTVGSTLTKHIGELKKAILDADPKHNKIFQKWLGTWKEKAPLDLQL